MNASLNHPLMIGYVRVQLTGGMDTDLQHWRWRTQSALNRVSLTGFGLPPQAILIVRQLVDPKPGQLLADDRWQSANQWGHHLHGWLSDHWRQALRPAYQTIPAHAGLVWFADRAEWLACLSWDIFAGGAHQHWWWHTWLQSLFYDDVGDMLYSLWQSESQSLPQSLSLLTKWRGIAVSALLKPFTSQQITALYGNIATQYKFPTGINPVHLIEQLAPLLPLTIQQIVYTLPIEHAAFIVLNFAIVHLPAITHSIRQQFSITESASQPTQKQRQSANSNDNRMMNHVDEQVNNPANSEHPDTHPDLPILATQSLNDVVLPSAEVTEESIVDVPVDSPDTIEHLSAKHTQKNRNSGDSRTEYSNNDFNIDQSATDLLSDLTGHLSIDRDLLQLSAENGVWSAYGGVWYLVNLLADLGWLYHTDDGEFSPYHRLYLLAQSLLGEDITDDPLWHILLDLAQEEFAHKAGRIWLSHALPDARHYIAEHLEKPEILQSALNDPAILYVTRTHIDVVFKLEQIRLELRLAGLDRNPAWIPELARIITFHYE